MKNKSCRKPQFPGSSPIAFLFVILIALGILLALQSFMPKLSAKQQIQPISWSASSPDITPTITPQVASTSSFIPQAWGNQVRVPILMYHYIGDNPDPKDTARDYISLGPTKFEEQMKYLKENGYTTITLDTLYPHKKKQITLPDKTVILTFDDGYMDFYYNAYPILRQYGLHATVFIPTALMDQGYYLTWAQIKEMLSSGLITFGSHGVHHSHLTTLSSQALEAEVAESKKTLQDILRVPINFIAYPYGLVNNEVIEATKKAGYIGAVGTWANKTQSEGSIYNMPRLRISGSITLDDFIQLL